MPLPKSSDEPAVTWEKLGPCLLQLLTKNLDTIVDPVLKTDQYNELVHNIEECFGRLEDIPWTIQRLCELIIWPTQHYNDITKYLQAVYKVSICILWKHDRYFLTCILYL